jgi:hypothetical protein
VSGERFPLRAPCRCGSLEGTITTTAGQDVMRCAACDRYQYNASRVETGRAVRTLASRPTITPAQRAHVLAVHDHACITCGRRPPEVRLELAHLISRADAERHGFLDALIDSEFNLAPQCVECNSGCRPLGSAGVRLVYRVLVMKALPRPELLL